MIETSLSRVKIHEVIESQIPEAIDSDNPLLGTFLKQYYISQEFQGGPVDIVDNFVSAIEPASCAFVIVPDNEDVG